MTTVVCHLRPSLRLALSVFAFAVVVTELHTVAALESTTEVAEVAVEECCAGRDSGCKRMGIGDGDCDSDAECQHGLKCGEDNCDDFRDSDDFANKDAIEGWDIYDDCCYDPNIDPNFVDYYVKSRNCTYPNEPCPPSAFVPGHILGSVGWTHWVSFARGNGFRALKAGHCNARLLWLTFALAVLQIAGGSIIVDYCQYRYGTDRNLGITYLAFGLWGVVWTVLALGNGNHDPDIAPQPQPRPAVERPQQPVRAPVMEPEPEPEPESAQSRGVRDGDTVLLACMTNVWSRRKNNWLSFDGRNNMRAMHVREQAVPLTLHSVPGQPDTYTIQSEGGWIGLEDTQMTANLPRERAARVRFHVERFKRSGRVTLLCVDNNRYISHRSRGGAMVATYGNGGQSTEGNIDYHLTIIGTSTESPESEVMTGRGSIAEEAAAGIPSALQTAQVVNGNLTGGVDLTNKLKTLQEAHNEGLLSEAEYQDAREACLLELVKM